MPALNQPLPDVIGDIKRAISQEIRDPSAAVSNWASRLGHPCSRYLTYLRLDGDKLPPIPVEKKMMFDLGHVFERHVAKVYLEKAGYEIIKMDVGIQSEKSGLFKRVKVHGYIDFIVRDPRTGFVFPVEAKSMNPYTWEDSDAIEDFTLSKHFWMRQYPGQLLLYLLAEEYEVGLFLAINKITAEPKAIWAHQDYTYSEELIKKAETVNGLVDRGEYPARIPYDDNICGRCDFAIMCLKDIVRTEAEILTDPDLVRDLEKREELKEAKASFEELDKSVKKRLGAVDKGLAGDFLIVGKTVNRAGYSVEPSEYRTVSIKKLK